MTGASFAKRFTALCLTLMMLLSTSVAVFAEPAGAEETLPESDATQSETQEGHLGLHQSRQHRRQSEYFLHLDILRGAGGPV